MLKFLIMKLPIKITGLQLMSLLFGVTAVHAQIEPGKKEPGINVSFMDAKTDAKNDFFRFVNGAWYDKTEIPADKTSWGSFNELRLKTDKDVLTILDEAS